MNEDFEEYEDNEEDFFERSIRIWSYSDIEKYLLNFNSNLSEEERTEINFYLIDKYYPGSINLSDDELLREKYYDSKHCFQYFVSIKRMIEESGEGCVFADGTGWHYGFGESL